jgi:cytochrome d ubiquinol oxidase subunit II
VAALVAWRGIAGGRARQVFLGSVALFLLAYGGLLASHAPEIVPGALDLWEAAAAPASQAFLLTGTLVLLPLVLGYTAFVFWVFRGKVGATGGYH